MRAGGPAVTESLSPDALGEVLDKLFPAREGMVNLPDIPLPRGTDEGEWNEERHGVQELELADAVARLRRKNAAPGPNGVPGRVLAMASGELRGRLISLFNGCLRSGKVPTAWKTGRLVLLPKPSQPGNGVPPGNGQPGRAPAPPGFRPIVVLDKESKLFERVLEARIKHHLCSVGPDLTENQYGFREGRSTIDAVQRLHALVEEATARGEVLLAISLDIANAFNTVPWSCILAALRLHGVPRYLRNVIRDYLQGRFITYPGRNGRTQTREVRCGVPQGSVLGPLLWNLAYDWVLRAGLLPGMSVLCYADDTLVIARGKSWEETIRIAELGTALVVGRIRDLGLRVALHKSEVMWFGPRRCKGPQLPRHRRIVVDGVQIEIGSELKYLGLYLDPKWCFEAHLLKVAEKVKKVAGSLVRLMPNLRGPRDSARRLYLATATSVVMYGAPVWHRELRSGRVSFKRLKEVHELLARRAIRGYHTVAGAAAEVVAGYVPWDITARALARVHESRVARRQEGAAGPQADARIARAERHQARSLAIQEWGAKLADPKYGERAIEAIRPVLQEWVDRRFGGLSFRMVQIITGHGCFGRYLCKNVRKEPDERCHHCDCGEDTAQHTLEVCPAWAEERRALANLTGGDLSLPTVIRAALGGKEEWEAFSQFCERVIPAKEDAERVRESDPGSLRNIWLRQQRRDDAARGGGGRPGGRQYVRGGNGAGRGRGRSRSPIRRRRGRSSSPDSIGRARAVRRARRRRRRVIASESESGEEVSGEDWDGEADTASSGSGSAADSSEWDPGPESD